MKYIILNNEYLIKVYWFNIQFVIHFFCCAFKTYNPLPQTPINQRSIHPITSINSEFQLFSTCRNMTNHFHQPQRSN